MNLVKYCNSSRAAEAVEKGKLFLGTFSNYKEIENDALRDTAEGSAIPAVLDDETEVVLTEDDNDTLLVHSPFKMDNGWSLNLPKGMPLWLEQPEFNTFIFCVSDDPAPSIEKANRLGYDSFYRITDPFKFGRSLMSSVCQSFGSKFGVTGYMGPVNYVPRKIQKINRKTPSSPRQAFCTADFFTKHQRFAPDKEYRFIVLEYSNADQTQFNSLITDSEIIENLEITKWLAKA